MKKAFGWLTICVAVLILLTRFGIVNLGDVIQLGASIPNGSSALSVFFRDSVAPIIGLQVATPVKEDQVIPVGQALAVGFENNLTIRIDSVKILHEDSDFGLGAEAIYAILATRDNGMSRSSRKLLAPGNGAYSVSIGTELDLSDFSLQVNHVADTDRIEVFFLGMESDELGVENELLNASIDVILNMLVDTVMPVTQGIAGLAMEALSGEALGWWQEQDMLGEYKVVLDKSNNWQEGSRHTVQSTNGNLEIVYSILRSTETIQPASETVTLTVENQSAWSVYTIYIWPSDGDAWHNKIRQEVMPDQSLAFVLETGKYNLRAEAERGVFWEQPAVEIARDRTWTITR